MRLLTYLNEDIGLKIPKGYKIAVYKIGSGMYYQYDYRIYKNGNLIQAHSGTTFNYKEDAQIHGVETANILAGVLPEK